MSAMGKRKSGKERNKGRSGICFRLKTRDALFEMVAFDRDLSKMSTRAL